MRVLCWCWCWCWCAVVVCSGARAVGRRGWSAATMEPPLPSSPIWPSCRNVGLVLNEEGGGGVVCVRWCSCGAGQPPLFERSDGAATLLEKVAARESSIGHGNKDEERDLPGVGPGMGGAGMLAPAPLPGCVGSGTPPTKMMSRLSTASTVVYRR